MATKKSMATPVEYKPTSTINLFGAHAEKIMRKKVGDKFEGMVHGKITRISQEKDQPTQVQIEISKVGDCGKNCNTSSPNPYNAQK